MFFALFNLVSVRHLRSNRNFSIFLKQFKSIKSTEKKRSSYLFLFERWKGNQLDAKVMARAPISWLDKCRKYNHFIGYISNSNFQIFKFKTNFCVSRFLLQNVFLKLINIFVFFVFIFFYAFSGSIKSDKSQKIFLPWKKIISAKENFRAPAWISAKFYLRERNG